MFTHFRFIFLTSAFVFSLYLLPSPATAQTEQHVAKLDRLLSQLPHSQVKVSACFIALPQGRVVYEKNSTEALIPASNQKIISGAAAVDILESDFSFNTMLYSSGDDLIIEGSGDPGFGDPKLAKKQGQETEAVFVKWTEELKKSGLVEISGDIIIDDQVFDSQWVHPSWEEVDLPKWYAAPVGGLNFNNNCIEVTFQPTKPGRPIGYNIFPPNDRVKVINSCTTGQGKPWIHRQDTIPTFALRGKCNKHVSLKPVSIVDPGIFTGEAFKHHLKSQGITVRGCVRRSQLSTEEPTTPLVNPHLVAVHRTPVADVLLRSLSDSQNFFAECLLKAAGREKSIAMPGSWESGSQVIKQRLQDWDIDTAGMVVADGSGLSRQNRASARQITQILNRMYLDHPEGSLFMDSMSLNDSHGTLHKRMKDIPRQVRGKSGYMKGVRCLSGYVVTTDNNWFAFSVLFNDIPGGTAPYNKIHDDACRILTQINP